MEEKRRRNLLSPDTSNPLVSTATIRKQYSIMSCRDWRCLAGASLCMPLNLRVLLFDVVAPLTIYLDSSHICVCSDASNRHLYPCAEAYGGCSGVRRNKTFAVLQETHHQGDFYLLHFWDHRGKQHWCRWWRLRSSEMSHQYSLHERLDSPVSLRATWDWCIIC